MRELADAGAVYLQLMDMAARLASHGLVHCDFNEFNILVRGFQLSTPALLETRLIASFQV